MLGRLFTYGYLRGLIQAVEARIPGCLLGRISQQFLLLNQLDTLLVTRTSPACWKWILSIMKTLPGSLSSEKSRARSSTRWSPSRTTWRVSSM